MTMIVRVKDKQFTVNDTLPLGAGATAFVYPAAVDGDVRQYVAKVGRPGLPPKDLALFYGELDILDSLRAAYPPGPAPLRFLGAAVQSPGGVGRRAPTPRRPAPSRAPRPLASRVRPGGRAPGNRRRRPTVRSAGFARAKDA